MTAKKTAKPKQPAEADLTHFEEDDDPESFIGDEVED